MPAKSELELTGQIFLAVTDIGWGSIGRMARKKDSYWEHFGSIDSVILKQRGQHCAYETCRISPRVIFPTEQSRELVSFDAKANKLPT